MKLLPERKHLKYIFIPIVVTQWDSSRGEPCTADWLPIYIFIPMVVTQWDCSQLLVNPDKEAQVTLRKPVQSVSMDNCWAFENNDPRQLGSTVFPWGPTFSSWRNSTTCWNSLYRKDTDSLLKDTQDEALCTRLICPIRNEAVLEALLNVEDEVCDFNKTIKMAMEVCKPLS